MRKWNVALGFYQNLGTAKAVFKELKHQGYSRTTLIHHAKEGCRVYHSLYPTYGQWTASAFLLLLYLILALVFHFSVANFFIGLAALSVLLAGGIWYFSGADTNIVKKYKKQVVIDEMLIIAEIKPQYVRDVLKILRQVTTGHPVSFLLRSDILEYGEKLKVPVEPLTLEQMNQQAKDLSNRLAATKQSRSSNLVLLKRLKKIEKIFDFLRHDIAEAEYIEQTITSSAEWLLDNTYVIQGAIEEIQKNLPNKYYQQLPKAAKGPEDGLPRIYAIAIELVNSTSARLSRENICNYLSSYQTQYPLTIGELWAFPLILRLRLVELVQSLAVEIDRRMREGESASFWGNRLLQAARREPDLLPSILRELAVEFPKPSPHFAEELSDHLFDEESVLPLARKWLEGHFSSPLSDVLHEEQIQETAEQVAFSNAITSLITLSQLAWQDIFEAVSPVDAILKTDPAEVYSKMDFSSRNLYRSALEHLAKYSKSSETEIAKKIVNLSRGQETHLEKHVGYYLIDKGRKTTETLIGYNGPWLQRLRNFIKTHPSLTYLGSIAAITLSIELILLYMSISSNSGWSHALLFILLSIIPVSEIAIQVVNFIIAKLLPPSALPKMLFEEGVPPEYKTLVVVPILLHNPESIKEEIDRLEIRYLANTDASLRFGLVCDFTDAPRQQMDNDTAILAAAVKGIRDLESKYGPGKFFLFHRQRVWSSCENAWIGWERKRGKLEFLNRFLMGEILPENIVYEGKAEELKGVRYVITLDSDTQLPKSQARHLIEVLSHPLNRPYLSKDGKRVLRGYSIIQPRVCTDFPHTKSSLFSKIFSDPAAIDPYTQAISNTYQDLTGEGAYHGKGIYDVEAFHKVLSGRFPDNHLLSHDLIEGAFVRAGYASDVCLFDLFPETYLAWSKRQHRWMRGDWQIFDWLLPRVPKGKGNSEKNPLSAMNQWKIFDNLRRALMPVALLLLLVVSWIASPILLVWDNIVLVVLFLPSILLALSKLVNFSSSSFRFSWRDLQMQILRDVITTALLPFEALTSLDALIRVIYRRTISKSKLLEWETFKKGKSISQQAHQRFILSLGIISLLSIIFFTIVYFHSPDAAVLAAFFCFLWLVAPIIIYVIDKPSDVRIDQTLSEKDRVFLRQVARKTWRFFDDFIGPQTNWLPPDNFQAALKIEVAPRTSPTNIGLWLLTIMSAYDFKFINCDDVIDRVFATMQSLKKLEFFEGHLLNWYDISNLQPLYPRYISTVDSGNFLASLWTLQQGINQMVEAPVLSGNILSGLKDTFALLSKEAHAPEIKNALPTLQKILNSPTSSLLSIIKVLQDAFSFAQSIHTDEQFKNSQQVYWLQKIKKELNAWELFVGRYLSWVEILDSLSPEQFNSIDTEADGLRKKILASSPSLQDLATGKFSETLLWLIELSQTNEVSAEINAWGKRLKEALATSQWYAGEKMSLVRELINEINRISNGMNLQFLYNQDRKVFAIGYNADSRRLDTSYYDLLASEARIASLTAIAKGEVPLDHWWALGRPYSIVNGRSVLLSWGGTMFEYLMPCLFNKQFPDSLLGDACVNAVACQIAYGKKRGIPWGISESAFSAIDAFKTYQYRSFGVPGLGLKRGLEDDLVVSPYSTALALAVDAPSAVKNLRRMTEKKDINLFGNYGFYESIDFTRQYGPGGERGVVVYAYMAHHQGMSIISIDNLLNNSIMTERFHADPRIAGVESLLYEKIPTTTPVASKAYKKERPHARLAPFSAVPIMGVVDTPESVTPKVNLLSNGEFSIMVTNSGGGYSRWRDIDITRWRSDTTCDCWGSFCYIKDTQSGAYWSTAFHPVQNRGTQYTTSFKSDKAEFSRKDYQIETTTEIVVSPKENAEIRLITLANLSSKVRQLEITSYSELALAPHAADRSHPCFNKMFIETEAIPKLSGIVAFRRLRSPDDMPIWAAHVAAINQPTEGELEYETDRMRFIGRGNTVQHPAALDTALSKTVGTVLDPIFSLRYKIKLEPGTRVQIAFITAVASDRDSALALMEKYKDITASHRAIELAWTYAQLELRHLRIHQEEAQLFQKLASRVLFPHTQLRASAERVRNNRLGQSRLWAYGISGDLPVIVVTVGDMYDADVVKQVLIAHTFWRLRGLKTDLLILNEETTSYEHPLDDQLQRLIQAYAYRNEVNTPGGVFIRTTDQIPEEELTLLLSVARAVIVSARGSLRQQLVSPMPVKAYPPPFIPNKKIKGEEPSRQLPFMELPYFNGIGGFTTDGKNYVMYLGPNTQSPIPWINVIANSQFGTIVTESGLGCTWYGNSQTNRLTPWSNDPVVNPISDAIFIRDEETGKFWTPTPEPIRELDAYRIHHGQGFTRFEHNSHGIEQDLTVFVPTDDSGGLPMRIQHLRLFNSSSRKRRLSITAYSDIVLGTNKEETLLHVVTEWDPESQAIFAYNRYHPDFGNWLAFASSVVPATSFTADRTEFIGRNSSLSNPASMRRKNLSGLVGVALDPCMSLQSVIDMEPGEHSEVIFILGYARDPAAARKLIAQCRVTQAANQLLQSTQEWWDKTLSAVYIDVPELSVNFMLNRWLPYQNLSCRFWGRTAFYQSSGAYGFRDQLQDVMALLYSHPEIARGHILYAASRQFEEGDVQHWWHPQSGGGIRTRITDDLLWLPFVTAHYVRVTGDTTILDEQVSFLQAPKLTEEQHEIYSIPEISKDKASLLEHCRRAVYKGITSGPHNLPLIGGGDWNDGMNLVGIKGKGESVWLAWFLIHVMNDFADLLECQNNRTELGEGYRAQAKRLAEMIEANAWDGEWYRRAYFDDGTPLGSISNQEASIDSLAQSWAVISGAGNRERSIKALASAEKRLVNSQEKIVKLLTPPFDHTALDPGYIKGYPPGVRENGGQYTHGSLWLPMAYARLGEGTKAVELLKLMNPVNHVMNTQEAQLYKVEPYIVAADVYDLPGQVGRGGWTWYTGSAAWMYRVWLEEILGFKKRGQTLTIEGSIPHEWPSYKLSYRFKSATYDITVENPHRISKGIPKYTVDGLTIEKGGIQLQDDGKTHVVNVVVEKQNVVDEVAAKL